LLRRYSTAAASAVFLAVRVVLVLAAARSLLLTVAGRGLHSSTFQLNLSPLGHLLASPWLIDRGETMH
jgi:hypothetical protein